MLIKRFFILPTLLVFLGITLSANAEYLLLDQKPAEKTASDNSYNVYLQADFSYANVAWNKFRETSGTKAGGGDGNFAYGVTTGFEFSKMLALEASWQHLPRVGFHDGSHVSSYMIYTAAKVTLPVAMLSHWYAKVGVAYRDLDYSDMGGGSFWNVIFGAGVDFDIVSGLRLGFEYLNAPGNFKQADSQNEAPNANMFIANLSYHFAI